jgi:hypothetical protein
MAIAVDRTSPVRDRGPRTVSRRSLLHLVRAAAITASYPAWSQGNAPPTRPIRAATGLRATWQSIARLGAERWCIAAAAAHPLMMSSHPLL